jgi:hypothetical protein
VEALQAGREHRAIYLVQQSSGEVHDTRWIDAEQVAVVREVGSHLELPLRCPRPRAARQLNRRRLPL